jgi:hypothetical protein
MVASASVVGEMSVAESTLFHIEQTVERRLQIADLSVGPAAEYRSVWEDIAAESGGFFDPYTGERDETKFQAAIDRMQAELSERFEFDAILYPEVWEVIAPYEWGEARWGGVQRLITGGRGYSGEIRAATLYLVIQDTVGNELYAHEAGIQLLEYMAFGELFAIEPERLFEDTTWTVAAVWRALDPLIRESSTSLPPL